MTKSIELDAPGSLVCMAPGSAGITSSPLSSNLHEVGRVEEESDNSALLALLVVAAAARPRHRPVAARTVWGFRGAGHPRSQQIVRAGTFSLDFFPPDPGFFPIFVFAVPLIARRANLAGLGSGLRSSSNQHKTGRNNTCVSLA